jgi:hypothetical protein
LFRQNFLTRILPARLEKDRYHSSVFVASATLLSLRLLGTHGVFEFFFSSLYHGNFLAFLYNCVASVTDSGVVGFIFSFFITTIRRLTISGSALSFLLKNTIKCLLPCGYTGYEVIKDNQKKKDIEANIL